MKMKIQGKIKKQQKKTHETIAPMDGRTKNGGRWQGGQTHSSVREDHVPAVAARVKGTTENGRKRQRGRRGSATHSKRGLTHRDVLYTQRRVSSTRWRVLAG
jgi:hypothetical protein